jgi:hypothetical protein
MQALIRVAILALFCAGLIALPVQSQMLVVNNQSGTVGEYALDGQLINPSFISGVSSPTAIAVADGYVYLALQSGVIRKYTTSGVLVNPSLVSGLVGPFGLVVSGGYLYAANSGTINTTVEKFTTDGAVVNSALIKGLTNPTGLAVSGNDLYVSTWEGGTVGKYTTDGATINANLISGIYYAGGLGVEGGHLFVNTPFDGVKLYATNGVLLNNALTPATYSSGNGLLVDGSGHIFVANNYGGAGGNYIAEYTTSGALINQNFITGLSNPVAMALIPEPSSVALLLFGVTLCLIKRTTRSSH